MRVADRGPGAELQLDFGKMGLVPTPLYQSHFHDPL